VKVLDFGIAKLTHEARDATLTATGSILGTPAYMSPEAITGRAVDARSDVYAVGGVIYYMLTGRPPFQEENVDVLLARQVSAEPPSLTGDDPTAPVELDDLLRRCLAKRPEDRFADGQELADAVAARLATGGFTDREPLPVLAGAPRAAAAATTITRVKEARGEQKAGGVRD